METSWFDHEKSIIPSHTQLFMGSFGICKELEDNVVDIKLDYKSGSGKNPMDNEHTFSGEHSNTDMSELLVEMGQT